MSQVLDVIDNYDRPGHAYSEGQYANADKYAYAFTNKRVPKAGAIAEAGVGRARAERSVFQAEAKGPNVSSQAGASPLGVHLEAQAGLGGATLSAGPFEAGLDANVGAHFNTEDILDLIDDYDRPGHAYTERQYARAHKYAYAFTNQPGQRVPKAGAIAEAGVGRARAEWSIFQVETKGPNASVAAHANVLGVSAMARAEVCSASASAGPVKVTVGLGLDTGVRAGVHGVEVKVVGTGIKVDKNGAGVSFIGNEVRCAII